MLPTRTDSIRTHAAQVELLSAPHAEQLVRKAIQQFRTHTGIYKPKVIDLYSGGAAYRRFGGETSEYLAVDAAPTPSRRMDVITVDDPLRLDAYRDRIAFTPDLAVSCFGALPDACVDCGPVVRAIADGFPGLRGMLLGSRGFMGTEVPASEVPDITPVHDDRFHKAVMVQYTDHGTAERREVFVWRMFTRTYG